MCLRGIATHSAMALALSVALVVSPSAQGAETFSGTATVKTAGGATATAPIAIVISRKMTQAEADKLLSAFRSGGAAALRKALAGVPDTGSVKVGNGEAIPTRITLERPTDKGRLLTIVTDKPILHLGAGLPSAKAKEGYDFAVLDVEIDAKGSGTGTLAPAAKVRATQSGIVVDDYGAEAVQLTGIKKTK